MKEARQPEFYVARLLTCNELYRKFYKERIALVKDNPGSIIFPESILSLNQRSIWGLEYNFNSSILGQYKYYEIRSPKLEIFDNRYNQFGRNGNIIDISTIEESESDYTNVILCLKGKCGYDAIITNSSHIQRYGFDPIYDNSSNIGWNNTPLLFTSKKNVKLFVDSHQRKLYRMLRKQYKGSKVGGTHD